jgi:hypothetical protein
LRLVRGFINMLLPVAFWVRKSRPYKAKQASPNQGGSKLSKLPHSKYIYYRNCEMLNLGMGRHRSYMSILSIEERGLAALISRTRDPNYNWLSRKAHVEWAHVVSSDRGGRHLDYISR